VIFYIIKLIFGEKRLDFGGFLLIRANLKRHGPPTHNHVKEIRLFLHRDQRHESETWQNQVNNAAPARRKLPPIETILPYYLKLFQYHTLAGPVHFSRFFSRHQSSALSKKKNQFTLVLSRPDLCPHTCFDKFITDAAEIISHLWNTYVNVTWFTFL
jgi:hypothetical protein